MADVVNIHEAKTHLSRLIERVEAGEEITIARAGRPVAKLVAVQQRRPRRPGLWKGRVRISPDFDAPLPEIVEAFDP
jgi:prevent-host-death family protein